jgi:hypothetical protein
MERRSSAVVARITGRRWVNTSTTATYAGPRPAPVEDVPKDPATSFMKPPDTRKPIKEPRRYISGFEDHPYFSPQAKEEQLAERGFKRIKSQKFEDLKTAASDMAKAPDARYSRKVEDYREIQDNDPYATLFGERVSVARVKLAEWRKQFERENADVELPYERTNVLFRAVPNRWVRFFVRVRSRGFMDPMYLHMAMGLLVCILWSWWNTSQTNSQESKALDKIG